MWTGRFLTLEKSRFRLSVEADRIGGQQRGARFIGLRVGIDKDDALQPDSGIAREFAFAPNVAQRALPSIAPMTCRNQLPISSISSRHTECGIG